ncbi:MAG: hypothetical protein AAFY88_15065 [Acidobacteriota bacterium]
MCQTINGEGFPDQHPRRELDIFGGRISQCLGCGTVGIEFGTTYLVYSESEFLQFVDWFQSLRWDEQDLERGKLRVGVTGEESVMLSLARGEFETLVSLMARGAQWIMTSGLIAEPDVDISQFPERSTAALVH